MKVVAERRRRWQGRLFGNEGASTFLGGKQEEEGQPAACIAGQTPPVGGQTANRGGG